MSNEYTDRLNNIKINLMEYSRVNPVSWNNDETRLNASNLNSLTNSIREAAEISNTNEGRLKNAIDNIVVVLSDITTNLSIVAGIDDYVNELEEESLATLLSNLDSRVLDIRGMILPIEESMETLNSNMTSELNELKARVTALENNMIASGTTEPEQAGLGENIKYYIKYED